MKILVIKIVGLLLASLATTSSYSQILPDSITKRIDALFKNWDNENSPGCTIGIVRNDTLIYAKGYGMANLEYGVPNTPETICYIASVSKQFTAYSIILLARQGKLKLDDDIHKYLAWFPDLKEKITIRNLLNNTSGIREELQLLGISGTNITDVIRRDHVIKVLGKQRSLDFKPGEQYRYSNSNFTLLAEIVRSVTGQSLRKFSDSAIFKPLGMTHTLFFDDHTEIVKNRSYSYASSDSGRFEKTTLNHSNVGSVGLLTNIEDMSKWVMNFYNPRAGDKKDIELLTTNGKLNDGETLRYAAGIFSDKFKGWRQFSHSGSLNGFRAFISVLPDAKMGFIVLGNLTNLNPGGKVRDLADLFIKDTIQNQIVNKKEKDRPSEILKDPSMMQKFLGNYISLQDGEQISIEMKQEKLYTRGYNEVFLLGNNQAGELVMVNNPEVKFILGIHSKDTNLVVTAPGGTLRFLKFTKNALQPDELLKRYAGTYYCPELDCKYGIVLKDHQLFLTNHKYRDAKITVLSPHHLLTDFGWMSQLLITLDANNQITGFEVNCEPGGDDYYNNKIMHLRFNKIE